MVSLFLYKTYMYKKEEEHANALVNRRTSSLWSELFSISLPPSVPKERYESSSCNRRIFLARPTLSKLTLSFKRHRAIGGAKRKKTSGGLAKHRLRSVARELQVARRRLSRLPRTFSTSSPRAFRLFPVLLLRLFSFFSPFSLSLSLFLSLFLSYSRSIFYLFRIRSRTSTPLPIFMALVPSVCSHFFFERSSRHQDTTCASVTSEVRASLTTIMTHTWVHFGTCSMIYAAFTGHGTRGLPFVSVKFISVVKIYIYIYTHIHRGKERGWIAVDSWE